MKVADGKIKFDGKVRKAVVENVLGYIPCCVEHHPISCPSGCKTSKHLAFHKSVKHNRWIWGGNSAGKSRAGISEMVLRSCFKVHPYNGLELPHPANHRVLFESLRNFESYYLPLLKEQMPKEMLLGGTWEKAYSAKYNILKLINGDMFDFLSYDMDVGKHETQTIHDCWADEKIPEDIYNATMARLLRTDGYFWCTVTPIAGMPWIMSRIWGKDDANTDQFIIGMDENPYLSAAAKERTLDQMEPEEREARRSGMPLQMQGLVYKLDERVHLTGAKPEPHWPVYFAMDAHPRKPAFGAWCAVSPDNEIFWIAEMECKGTPKELTDRMLGVEYDLRQWIGTQILPHAAIRGVPSSVWRYVVKRWIDLSAITLQSDIQDHYDVLAEFRKLGFAFDRANRSQTGYQVVKQYLSFNSSKPYSQFNKPMMYFCKGRVPKLWASMTHLMWDEYRHSGSRDPKEKVRDWMKDPADCVRYVAIERPTYRREMQPVATQNDVYAYTQ